MSRETERGDPVAVVESRIADGRMDAELVERAREHWRQTLHEGITLPNGERVYITWRDLHHLLLDERILRKSGRIERLLQGIYELRTTHSARRRGLSQWTEGAKTIYGYAILEADHLWTAHIADPRKLRKLARQGELLWTQEEPLSLGEAQNEIS